MESDDVSEMPETEDAPREPEEVGVPQADEPVRDEVSLPRQPNNVAKSEQNTTESVSQPSAAIEPINVAVETDVTPNESVVEPTEIAAASKNAKTLEQPESNVVEGASVAPFPFGLAKKLEASSYEDWCG